MLAFSHQMHGCIWLPYPITKLDWISSLVRDIPSYTQLGGRKNYRIEKGSAPRGLVSPYLFNIPIDFLSRWIRQLTWLQMLQWPFQGCRICVLHADDALLFLRPNQQQMRLFKLIMLIFQKLLGLRLNLAKSELLVARDNMGKAQELTYILSCNTETFPIIYLELSLSDKRLPDQLTYHLYNRKRNDCQVGEQNYYQ
jgi:hypothetical protein